MKVLKNKKRIDPRYYLDEKRDIQAQKSNSEVIEEIKTSFNGQFSFDTWLNESNCGSHKRDDDCKPDYIDADKDGNEDECMSDAVKDAKSKTIKEMYVEAPPDPKEHNSSVPSEKEENPFNIMVTLNKKDHDRDRSRADTLSQPQNEGNCESEMPLEDEEEMYDTDYSDNTFNDGYEAAVEDIVATLRGLLEDPIEAEDYTPEQLPVHPMEDQVEEG